MDFFFFPECPFLRLFVLLMESIFLSNSPGDSLTRNLVQSVLFLLPNLQMILDSIILFCQSFAAVFVYNHIRIFFVSFLSMHLFDVIKSLESNPI